MISDSQLEEVVIAEHIDRISRLPLDSALALVDSIKERGAKLAISGIPFAAWLSIPVVHRNAHGQRLWADKLSERARRHINMGLPAKTRLRVGLGENLPPGIRVAMTKQSAGDVKSLDVCAARVQVPLRVPWKTQE